MIYSSAPCNKVRGYFFDNMTGYLYYRKKMANNWQSVNPSSPISLSCFGSNVVTVKVTVPKTNQFIIKAGGETNIVGGEDITIERTQDFRGGQCIFKRYFVFYTIYYGGFADGRDDQKLVYAPITDIRWTPSSPGQSEIRLFHGNFIGNPAFTRVSPQRPNSEQFIYPPPFITDVVRQDGTSVDDDVAQCGGESEWIATVTDCNGDEVFQKSYGETQPTVTSTGSNTANAPQYFTVPLRFGESLWVDYSEDTSTTPPTPVVQIGVFGLTVLPTDIPGFDPTDPGVPGFVRILKEFRSDKCAGSSPKVEYMCNSCETCPPGTACEVQQGNTICCYDELGNKVGEVEACNNDGDNVC